jgi:glycerol-3-phosphate dehydrogenase
VVGCAAAYELAKYQANGQPLRIAVVERENDVSMGASRANTGIIHAGYDPPPGSLMAKVNVEGNRLAREICARLDVPLRRCGSLVISLEPEHDARLKMLYERGIENGVPDMELLSASQTLALEPNLSPKVRGALLANTAMTILPWDYALAMLQTAARNGAEVFLSSEVTAIEKIQIEDDVRGANWKVKTLSGDLVSRMVVNAAGLRSDEIHNMAAAPSFAIKPGRGEFYLLDKSEGGTVGHVIFQCPGAKGKGVTVTPTVHNTLIVGPNNEAPPEREDVSTTRAGMDYVASQARLSVPGLNMGASIRNYSGIRAASDKEDFIVGEAAECFFDLAGIKSPGLVSAPAIAKELVKMICEKFRGGNFQLEEKKNYIDERKVVRFAELSSNEQDEIVKRNPAYGRIVCRCETVTEGEILAALASPLPPHTIDGVKRRCGPGLGRCQGGFCGPRVVELLARHYGIDSTKILMDRDGSWLLEDYDGGRHA